MSLSENCHCMLYAKKTQQNLASLKEISFGIRKINSEVGGLELLSKSEFFRMVSFQKDTPKRHGVLDALEDLQKSRKKKKTGKI